MKRRESEARHGYRGTAYHALHCGTCKPKAQRILVTTSHIERFELLAQIELHEQRASGRRLHG